MTLPGVVAAARKAGPLVAIADFNNDSYGDILWQNDNGRFGLE